MKYYESPHDQTPSSINQRCKYANAIYEWLTGTTVVDPPDDGSGSGGGNGGGNAIENSGGIVRKKHKAWMYNKQWYV